MKFLFSSFSIIYLLLSTSAFAAPEADLWPRWQAHDNQNDIAVDHTTWGDFLQNYLETGHRSGINRFRYNNVLEQDRSELNRYLEALQQVKISRLARKEQKAYWINFYNALTIKVILDHYPVKSIRDIDISPGFFNDGPWDKKLVTVEETPISLNDMEHRILRPIWKDNRVHYAVNCASIGCPNLQGVPFTAANTESLLEKGAREHVNHPRGAEFSGGKLFLSSIYKWFQEDFAGSEQGVLEHLGKHADSKLAENIRTFKGRIQYRYDWSLNE